MTLGRKDNQDDDMQWYALRVVPQKEYTVAYLLEKRGVWAYVPTGMIWRKRTWHAKAKAEYACPERPGMIFARFPSTPAWYNVLKNHLILGPIGRDGAPWRFDPAQLYNYFARVPNGTLVFKDGEQLVHVNGRNLRAPTTQTRIISKRKKEVAPDDLPIVEPTRQERIALQAMLMSPAKNVSPQPVLAAA
jgi:hypothetical protein